MTRERCIGELVSASRYIPERGDILWLTFDPGLRRLLRDSE